uniref:SCAN box domain-containing protein n=1 Tax=Gopherus agassizii TaxID=38772 RepID=A0A452ICK2_9SAUR
MAGQAAAGGAEGNAKFEDQARNYEVVKAAILDQEGLSVEKYQQKFRAVKWTGGLQPQAFTQKLTDWATCWLRLDTQTVGEIMDVLILEQFLQGLPENIKVWVRRHQPNMVEAVVKLTEEYVEVDFPRKEGHSSSLI